MSDLREDMDRRSFMKVGTLGAAAAVSGLAGSQDSFAAPAVKPALRRLGPNRSQDFDGQHRRHANQ